MLLRLIRIKLLKEIIGPTMLHITRICTIPLVILDMVCLPLNPKMKEHQDMQNKQMSATKIWQQCILVWVCNKVPLLIHMDIHLIIPIQDLNTPTAILLPPLILTHHIIPDNIQICTWAVWHKPQLLNHNNNPILVHLCQHTLLLPLINNHNHNNHIHHHLRLSKNLLKQR